MSAHQTSPPLASLIGKVIVLTGATSGIGRVAAERLAAMGARMVLVARDRARGEATLARLREISPGIVHTVYYADLSRLSEMKRVSAEIAAAEPRIDVLLNNAGAEFNRRQVTEDGLERTFALNHLSYFVVTHGLREQLGIGARVVNTASRAHRAGRLDLNDLQSAQNFAGFRTYGTSKLCNILFTRELARRWESKGVTVNALHPGFVATRFGHGSGGFLEYVLRVAQVFALTPEQGAETLVYLAASPEVAHVNGQYFAKCRPDSLARAAQDDTSARILWEKSEELAGIRY